MTYKMFLKHQTKLIHALNINIVLISIFYKIYQRTIKQYMKEISKTFKRKKDSYTKYKKNV